LISFDPELASLESIALQLENDDLVLPLFRLIEIPDISESLMRSTSSEDGKQAPRAFIGGLIIDGTVKELLNILDWLLDQTQKLTADLTEDTDEDHSN
jgi:hypothetical protein